MVCRCAYVLVCELDENRLLAETVLALLTRLIREHVTSLEQKNAEVHIYYVHTYIHWNPSNTKMRTLLLELIKTNFKYIEKHNVHMWIQRCSYFAVPYIALHNCLSIWFVLVSVAVSFSSDWVFIFTTHLDVQLTQAYAWTGRLTFVWDLWLAGCHVDAEFNPRH